MMDVTKTKYAEWLENVIEKIMEESPEKIGIVFEGMSGEIYTSYFGNCFPPDKATMAYWIHSDAIMDTVVANSRMIIDAAENELEYDDLAENEDIE